MSSTTRANPEPADRRLAASQLYSCVHRNLVFVHGKGGVGKSLIAQALALGLTQTGARVLLTEFENPTRKPGDLTKDPTGVWQLNADAMIAFEEYCKLKIEKMSSGLLRGLSALGASTLTRIFTHNKLIKYLAQAAPGIHDLVLMGKLWHERENYDHVIVDMPSTGYGLAMFQSSINFSKLFSGSPLSQDADDMMVTFKDPSQAGHLIIALPEEMPLQEGIELNGFLKQLFPANPAAFLINKHFPGSNESTHSPPFSDPFSPYASSVAEYISRRRNLEAHNLRLWSQAGLNWMELNYLKPMPKAELVASLTRQMKQQGLL